MKKKQSTERLGYLFIKQYVKNGPNSGISYWAPTKILSFSVFEIVVNTDLQTLWNLKPTFSQAH